MAKKSFSREKLVVRVKYFNSIDKPLETQINGWLEANPDFFIKDIKLSSDDEFDMALVIYFAGEPKEGSRWEKLDLGSRGYDRE